MFASGESGYQLARALSAALAIVLALALERWRPHRRLRPAWGANLGLWVIGSFVMLSVCGACGWIVAAWAASRDLGLLAWLGLGTGAAIAIGVLALDGVSWAWHRANHRLRLLWRFHQVHHADAAFHVTTALRFHPGELLLALPVRLAAVVLLGVPPEGVLVFEVIFGIANLMEHGNFDLSRRIEHALRPVLVTPALHRRHHASNWSDLDTNFGTVFSFWDRLARTFRSSEPGLRVVTGLPDRSGFETPALGESLWLPFARGSRRIR